MREDGDTDGADDVVECLAPVVVGSWELGTGARVQCAEAYVLRP